MAHFSRATFLRIPFPGKTHKLPKKTLPGSLGTKITPKYISAKIGGTFVWLFPCFSPVFSVLFQCFFLSFLFSGNALSAESIWPGIALSRLPPEKRKASFRKPSPCIRLPPVSAARNHAIFLGLNAKLPLECLHGAVHGSAAASGILLLQVFRLRSAAAGLQAL